MTSDDLRNRACEAHDFSMGYLKATLFQAADEIDRLKTWNGLMQTLDELYPQDIVPTLPDDPGRDTGARIVSLLRIVDELRRLIKDMSGPPWKEVIRKRIDAALKESQP